MIGYVRILGVFITLVPLTLLLIPIQIVSILAKLELRKSIPLFWHRIVLKMLGMRVSIKGTIPDDLHTALIVSNHISWSDIPVLGSCIKLSFIAKQEVLEMPGVSLLAKLQETVFVKREAKGASGRQAREVTSRLFAGDNIVLFAEGTTSFGHMVGQFKSSLFGAAQYAVHEGELDKVTILPVSICYTKLHGMPSGRIWRGQTGWPGDVSIGAHALNLLLKAAWDVEVFVGEPLSYTAETKRKQISKQVEEQVKSMFAVSSSGRERDKSAISI